MGGSMDYYTDIIINCSFEGISKQNFPKNECFELVVSLNGIKYEFLITLKDDSDYLFVGVPSALPKSYSGNRLGPYFEKWDDDYDMSTIFFNDPTLYINDNLKSGWGIGTPEEWYLENISKIIIKLVDKINISHKNIMFHGSAEGGFMAIALATLIKNSIAIADSPQTILYAEPEIDIWRWHWNEIVKYCFNNLSQDYILENYKYRLNLLELIKQMNYIPNVYLLCDCSVETDFTRYYVPFFNSLNELPFNKDSNYMKFIIFGNNKGHRRLDKKKDLYFINLIKSVSNPKYKKVLENKIYQTPNMKLKNFPIKTFYCLGSCATRDAFNSTINPNYKQYFRVTGTGSQLSLISLMDEKPFHYTDEDINASELKPFEITVIEKELKKTGLNELIDLNYDYLIIDNYFEMKFGVCMVQDKIVTNNYWHLHNTPLFKNLKNKKLLTIQSNPNEYYKLWCEKCDLFFKFLNEYKPEVKVILNPVRNSTSFIESDGSVKQVREDIYKRLILENIYISMFDEYILNKFDVDVLIFDGVHKADKNHPWNFNYVHYEPSYYQEFTNKLNLLIERDVLMDYNSHLSFNIRENNKKLFLNKLEDTLMLKLFNK